MQELGLIQIAVLVSSIYYFGIIYGLLFIVILIQTVDAVLDRFGYQRAILGDILFSFEPRNLNNFGWSYHIMEKISFELYKKEKMKRWIMQIRRFRQKLITRFGFKLWRDVELHELDEAVVKSNVKCTNLEELTAYANKLSEEHKLTEDTLLYQFYVIEDYNGKSVVLSL